MSEQESTREKLIHAYDRMMENLHALIEQAGGSRKNLQQMLEKSRDKAAEMENLTREEAEKVSQYLKRDLHQAGDYMDKTGHEMRDWLYMDMELIEWNLLDMFLSTADRTKVDLLLLEENAKHVNEYHTGEITGPGVLTCDNCGEELHYTKTGHIPPCPKCHGTAFSRKSR